MSKELIERLLDNRVTGFNLTVAAVEAADRIMELERELEREQMRLVACGVVAMCDTPESAEKARQMHPDYESASCSDVARRVDECIELRKRIEEQQSWIASLEQNARDADRMYKELETELAEQQKRIEELEQKMADDWCSCVGIHTHRCGVCTTCNKPVIGWWEVAKSAIEDLAAAQAEIAHWKNNHETEVRRARILKERTDMPIERVQAYEKWGEDQRTLAASQAHIKVLREALDFVLNGSTELDQRASIDKARKALAQPTDDSALREMLKAERERVAQKLLKLGALGDGDYIAAIRAMEDQ